MRTHGQRERIRRHLNLHRTPTLVYGSGEDVQRRGASCVGCAYPPDIHSRASPMAHPAEEKRYETANYFLATTSPLVFKCLIGPLPNP